VSATLTIDGTASDAGSSGPVVTTTGHTVYAFTINRYRWLPQMSPPYVVAFVELVEQAGLQILTNIVGCAVDDVHTGMAVEVVFAHNDDVYIPLFRPAIDK